MKNRINHLKIFVLITITFLFGVSTGRYKHFPYDILYFLKYNQRRIEYFQNDYKGRNFNLNNYEEVKSIENGKVGVFLTYGQSNSVSSGEPGYFVKNNVYQYSSGTLFKYKDPVLSGSLGLGGSVWGLLGDKLIDKGLFNEVIFSNCGWGGRKISELNKGHYFNFLVENYNSLIYRFGKVDGILFHQGESDNNPNGTKNYYKNFVDFLNKLKDLNINTPIYLSRVSYCGDKYPKNEELISIQNKIVEDFENVKFGPNTDLLIEDMYRTPDKCHFSLLGFDKFSDMWVESIIK